MANHSILIMLHCEQNTGFAIAKLEPVFEAAAKRAGFSTEQIIWSYKRVTKPASSVYELEYYSPKSEKTLRALIRDRAISTIIAFDMPFPCVIARTARQCGIENIVSYWGASMSDLNHGIKLLLKRLEFQLLRRSSAHTYVFESMAMQRTAYEGRGIPRCRTAVIPLGVDEDVYTPSSGSKYIYEKLNIPRNRKIVFYSGHMEERKGVKVIVNAAIELARLGQLHNLHFVFCGNQPNEEIVFLNMLRGTDAETHVTFAGYRDDVPDLMASSHIGVIASTGWDSFTRSGAEMLACGLPVLVSNLGGLPELIADGESGLCFEPGNHKQLAELITKMEDTAVHRHFSVSARERAVSQFSESKQIDALSKLL